MQLQKYIELNNEIKQKGPDGFFRLEMDQLAINEFQKYLSQNTMQFENPKVKFDWLINQQYYINFYEKYTEIEIIELLKKIYDYKFEFKSFMAISKFYSDYALKNYDKTKFLETYEDRIVAVSLFLGEGDYHLATTIAISLIEQRYQPATPTFLNAGKKNSGELVSCFLLEMDDTLNSINYNLSVSMQLSKLGGGIAINLSKLRALNDPIKNIKGASSGILPVLKLLEDAFSYVDQLGQRQGAGAAYLNIFHPDVINFLDTKKINADEKTRIQTLSLGLIVPDKFFELAKKNQNVALFSPYEVYQEYQIHLDDMDMNQMYDELITKPKLIKDQIPARELLQKIAISQFESGYPYIVYIDEANRQNPLKNIGKIKMSNLCTEIFQIQTTSTIGDYGEGDNIGYDINCNLGSLNIANVMELKNIQETVHTATIALTSVTNQSNIANAPGVRKANELFHSIGLGAMNLHGYLAKNNIPYESDAALEFVDTFFAIVNFYSIQASMQIAVEKKTTFHGFNQSTYADGTYFQKYLTHDFIPTSEKIKKLFSGIYLPTRSDWLTLSKQVAQNGLYHSYRMAIAPTQSISYIQNATSSILPVVDIIETRMYGKSITYYPMPYLRKDNVLIYKSAYNMNQFKILDLIKKVQNHVDQGISTILFVNSNASTKDLAKLYFYANQIGLKSLYYTRTKNLSVEECLACAV